MTRDISKFVPLQVPQYIRETYPNFIVFIQAYYEWLMQEGNAGWAALNLENIRDVDRTTDTFIQWFRETYLASFPVNAFVQNENYELIYITKTAMQNALSIDCVCNGTSAMTVLPMGSETAIDSYSLEAFRAIKWIIHAKDALENAETYQVLATPTSTGDIDFIKYAVIGGTVLHDIDVRKSGDIVTLYATNNTPFGPVEFSILREPVLVSDLRVTTQRTFLIDKRVTNQTKITVYVNGVAIDNDKFSIGPEVSYCNSWLRELTIADEQPLAVGDEVKIVLETTSHVDERLLIKNIRDIYAQKGTEASIRLLFKLLFNEDIEIDYPGKRILRASDGKWDADKTTIRILNHTGVSASMLYRQIEFLEWSNIFEEYVSVGTAVVEEVVDVVEGGVLMSDLQLIEIKTSELPTYYSGISYDAQNSQYVPTQIVRATYTNDNGDTEQVESLIVPAGYEFTLDGISTDYNVGDRIYIEEDGTSEYSYGISAQYISGVTLIPHGFDTNIVDSHLRIVHKPINSPTTAIISPEYVRFTGDYVEILDESPFQAGDQIVIEAKASGFGGVVSATDSEGIITGITIYSAGFGIVTGTAFATDNTELLGSPLVEIPRTGSPDAKLIVSENVFKLYGGYYLNYDGHLSSYPVLQDGRIYNAFTYVIKSSRMLKEYKDVLTELVHPAGFGVWGQVQLIECLHMFIRSFTTEITTLPVSIHSVSERYCGPNYNSLDGRKLEYGFTSIDYTETSPSTNIRDLVTGDQFLDDFSPSTIKAYDIDTQTAANTTAFYFGHLTLGPFVDTPFGSVKFLPDSSINQYPTITYET